jgi:hypothetical protein
MLRTSAVALSSWRSQGLSYVKYLNVATTALHRCVKPSKKAKFAQHSETAYAAQVPDGQGSFTKFEKVPKTISEYQQ